jgi:hypothetical protein
MYYHRLCIKQEYIYIISGIIEDIILLWEMDFLGNFYSVIIIGRI